MLVVDVSVTELRANLAECIRRAREGEEVIITDHDVPVARLSGLSSTSLIERLTEQGLLTRPTSSRRTPASELVAGEPTPGPPISDYVRRQRDGEDV
jgi:prevent-host-death family protein